MNATRLICSTLTAALLGAACLVQAGTRAATGARAEAQATPVMLPRVEVLARRVDGKVVAVVALPAVHVEGRRVAPEAPAWARAGVRRSTAATPAGQ